MSLQCLAFPIAISALCAGVIFAQEQPGKASPPKAPPASAQAPSAQPAPAHAMKFAAEVQVAPGPLTGRVLSAADRIPVGSHTMKLESADSSTKETLVTQADGTYRTPALEAGSYSLRVRSDLLLNLVVTAGSRTRSLDILLPAAPEKAAAPASPAPADPSKVPAAPGGAAPSSLLPAPEPAITGLGTGTWVLIGAGAATAVAIPVVAAQRRSSTPVSPVQPLNSGLAR
ncbi:MAG: hypothetical protein Fur0037_11510 [Planctomycetota bacterium]